MTYGVYSIRDVKTGFMSLTLDVNDLAAQRNFSHAVLNATDLMQSHPQDFSLYHLADYDSDTGKITPLSLPQQLLEAQSVLVKEVPPRG